MNARRLLSRWLVLLGIASSACVAMGYDFEEYERSTPGSAGSSENGGAPDAAQPATEPEPPPSARPAGPATSHGGAAEPAVPRSAGGGGAAREGGAGAASDACADLVAGTLFAAGAPGTLLKPTRVDGAGGDAGAACQPLGCIEQAAECGALTDGCGRAIECGRCFWWFSKCRENRCSVY